jgi:hypothetical protein
MDAINWLLINAGNAAQWLWHALGKVFGVIFGGLDAVLNPVLSPVLAVLNPVCTWIGDGVYAVLSPLPTWAGLTLLSVVAGVVMLIAFRYTSNQAAIGRARDDIAANLLALKLFKDELRVAFRSQWRLLKALGRLQWHMLRPILIMLLPMLLALGQMGLRYQWRPLQAGERTLIKVRLSQDHAPAEDAQLEPDPGLVVEAGPVPGGGELVWRVRAGQPGRHLIRFTVAGRQIDKEVVVGRGLQRVSAKRLGSRWTSQLFHPAEPLLPSGSPVQSIEILYGGVDSWVYGANWWVLYFFVVSMAAALVLKPIFKVRF